MKDLTKKKSKAVLVSVQLPGVSDQENEGSLNELARLVETLGFEIVGRVSQKRKAAENSTILGEGKLKELARYTGGKGFVERFQRPGQRDGEDETEDMGVEEDLSSDESKPKATIAIFDHEITPTQLRNLEEATGVEVMDRTGVILEIFSRHARSREARLQVEIAKLGYMAPRLRASKVGGDRQGGGIGAKGAGESAHELDKRRIRDRIAELRQQLQSIHNEQGTRRLSRREAPCVALVGYTNAGKSSLMRALTGSEVLVADKLFATLDTTVRALQPESTPRVLISDTVGFIKKLPHDLVASFRSTLDEALNASLLLFTVDASDPNFRSQLEVTRKVLDEIGAQEIPYRLVLNKCDRLDETEQKALRREFPEALLIATVRREDVRFIREQIIAFFESDMVDEEHFIPYSRSSTIGSIREKARVIAENHEDEGSRILIRATPELQQWIKKLLA